MKQVSRCPPLRYGAQLSSLAMSASTISMVSRCQVSRFQSPRQYKMLSIGDGDFRPPPPPHLRDHSTEFHETITTSRTRPHIQDFTGLYVDVHGWSAQIASLTHASFCPFLFAPSLRPQVASLETPRTQYVVPAKKLPFGVRNMKFEIWPHLPPKNSKNWD